MREFVGGAALLVRGFSYWSRRPRAMALGLIPAGIVSLVFLAGLITLGSRLPDIAVAITPFVDGWPGLWANVFRIAVGTALIGAALVLVAVTFTAATLIVGDPFYERIWRAVEEDLGDEPSDAASGFWVSVRDGLSLVVRGLGVAVVAALLGLIPGVGGVVSAVVGVTLTGWLLADELASRALTARGMKAVDRGRALRGDRARVLGFGVATQLCFMVPLGAIATMPAAVAGATLLARSLRSAHTAPPDNRHPEAEAGRI